MSLRILHCAPGAAAPEGLHELARIHCAVTPSGRLWDLPLQVLEGAGEDELWCVPDTVRSALIQLSGGTIEQRSSQDFSIYWLQLDPAEFDNFTDATRYAWQQVLYSLQAGHPCLLKAWHYLPGINAGQGDQERYRQFCQGRQDTLTRAGFTGPLPAATAIGIPDPDAPLVMYWLTGHNAGHNIENPRQISAWEYPRDYGPSSPNFSRATLAIEPGLLLISGTASVVGHATSHPMQTVSQTIEMLTNLDKLLEAGNSRHQPMVAARPSLRIYLRDPADWREVKRQLFDSGLRFQHLLPLAGDICRRDLMVELDGFLLDSQAGGTHVG